MNIPLSRRHFLSLMRNAAFGAAAAKLSFEPRILMAQSALAGSDKNIVVVNLLGGLDGLAAFPYYDGSLSTIINSELRPTIKINPVDVLKPFSQAGIAQKIGCHPALAPLITAASSRLKIVKGYGIPGDPGRSHDTCQILMSLGTTAIRSSDSVGFLARLMDNQNWDTLQYWALASTNPMDVNAQKHPPVTVSDISNFDFPSVGWESSNDRDYAVGIAQELLQVQTPRRSIGDKYKEMLGIMNDTVTLVRRDISTQVVGSNSAGNYTDSNIGSKLRDAAKILKAKVTTPSAGLSGKDMLILTAQDGYDTHSNQAGTGDGSVAESLGSLGGNLAVFYRDLEVLGILNKTVVVVYSEFGRTPYQNGSPGEPTVGTDHGHASNTIVFGGPVTGGVIGGDPTTTEIRDGDYNALLPKVDFRDIFSEIFGWMGIDPKAIFDDPAYTPTDIGLV